MDRKTLEYMKERVEKAEEIIARLDHLTKIASDLAKHPEYADITVHTGSSLFRVWQHQHGRMLNKIVDSIINSVADEIAHLEQELAEL